MQAMQIGDANGQSHEHRHGNSQSVVVLCAQEEVRDVITYWFTSIQVRTFVAADGYEASRSLKEVSSGLLVTDRVLPPWPGLETFRQLRIANPRLRIAFVEDGTPDGQILARVTGATDILPRPLSRKLVVDMLGQPELSA